MTQYFRSQTFLFKVLLILRCFLEGDVLHFRNIIIKFGGVRTNQYCFVVRNNTSEVIDLIL